MGLDQGADMNAGTIASGSSLDSFNGYEGLTFEAQEENPANFIDCTDETTLKAVFNNGTDDAVIVTS